MIESASDEGRLAYSFPKIKKTVFRLDRFCI
jgi:hypothetical protein